MLARVRTPSSLVREREKEIEIKRGGRERERERERKREGGGERERDNFFLIGMTGALAPFSYLVSYIFLQNKLTLVNRRSMVLSLPAK